MEMIETYEIHYGCLDHTEMRTTRLTFEQVKELKQEADENMSSYEYVVVVRRIQLLEYVDDKLFK